MLDLMALGVDYAEQDCSLARALELVGERWTLLILRDCFFGVRRFTDFQSHLNISRAVLTQRLTGLVDAGLLARTPRGGREEYVLTERGLAIWPALYALTRWGEAQSTRGPRRIFAHVACGTDLDRSGVLPDLRHGPASRRHRDASRPRFRHRRPGQPGVPGAGAPHRLLQPLLLSSASASQAVSWVSPRARPSHPR